MLWSGVLPLKRPEAIIRSQYSTTGRKIMLIKMDSARLELLNCFASYGIKTTAVLRSQSFAPVMKGTPPSRMTKKYISVRSSTDCHKPFPFGAKKALSLPLQNTPLPDPSDFVDSTCEVIPGKALSTGTWIRKVWQSLQKHLCCYVILWNSIIRLYAFSTEFWTCLVQSRLQTPTYSIEIYMWHKKNQSSELSFLLGFERSAGIQLLCGSLLLWIFCRQCRIGSCHRTISVSDMAVIALCSQNH